jgi:hypothetical protein
MGVAPSVRESGKDDAQRKIEFVPIADPRNFL